MIGESLRNRYLKWCTTTTGKNFWSRVAVGFNLGIATVLYLPQTYLLDYYQDLVQLYKDKKPAPLPEEMKSLFDEVVKDLNIEEYDSKLIKPFMLYGLEPFNAGIWNTKSGGIIGIPLNFTFKSPSDVDISRILIHNSLIDTSRPETVDLSEALVLSHDAQKFAIAREICTFMESSKVMDCLVAAGSFMSFYFFNQFMKQKFDMYKKTLNLRLALYTVSGLSCLGIYLAQKDFFKKRVEKNVDAQLSRLGPNYVRGGYEFYSKLLERNIAHRSLLDEYGKKHFDADGNPASFIRRKTTPFTQRKSFFEMLSLAENA